MTVITQRQPSAIRWFANILSFIFHPLFIPVYITVFLLYVHPLLFAGFAEQAKLRLVATVFINLALFPAAVVFLCWRLNFIDSIKLNTQKERLIPLAATMIFYFWGWYVLRSFNTIPVVFKDFLFGSFLTVIAGWLANIYYKVSLHALGMGGLVGFVALLILKADGGSAGYLAAAVLIAGLVCSARLLLSSHKGFEIYSGLLIGMACQAIATII